MLLLDSGPSLLPTWRNTHVKTNTVCLFFFFFIRESERDGYSGSGQELRWSESSDFWPHFFSHPTIRQVIKRRSEWHQSMTNRLPSTRAHCLPPNSYLRADLIHHLLHRSWRSASENTLLYKFQDNLASVSSNMQLFINKSNLGLTQMGVSTASSRNKMYNLNGKSRTNTKRRGINKTWEQTTDRNHRKEVNQNADLCVSLNQPSGAFSKITAPQNVKTQK